MFSRSKFQFLKRLKKRLWSTHVNLLLVHPANKIFQEDMGRPCPGEFRAVTEDNITDCAEFENAEVYVPIYRKMLAQGDYGVYGYLEGKCVYRHWMQCSGNIYYAGCLVRKLSERDRYEHYGFCSPSARGHGFLRACNTKLLLDNPNYTFYASISPNNIGSLISLYRNGYEIYSRITVKCRFLRRTLTETPFSKSEEQAFWLEKNII